VTRRSTKRRRKGGKEFGESGEVIVPGCGSDVPRCRASPLPPLLFPSKLWATNRDGADPYRPSHDDMHCLTRREREVGNIRV
jgi:hypothetical protein